MHASTACMLRSMAVICAFIAWRSAWSAVTTLVRSCIRDVRNSSWSVPFLGLGLMIGSSPCMPRMNCGWLNSYMCPWRFMRRNPYELSCRAKLSNLMGLKYSGITLRSNVGTSYTANDVPLSVHPAMDGAHFSSMLYSFFMYKRGFSSTWRSASVSLVDDSKWSSWSSSRGRFKPPCCGCTRLGLQLSMSVRAPSGLSSGFVITATVVAADDGRGVCERD
ncbi:hypothetical protein H257_07451 [Aphanomyces astaci]|uniref:Secreted protein n=1 Tax=Aphanomyces astaci TaxID=112090 RepID=W4GKK2_APHAT|nr:hypothetical protein H257_07451 [Aphanomyces astaci]ETV79443.1 hypothetical protein H257_07451 [Aphanomyces astaci]|eukprot:XP_009831284.1 hypothetical protein H257_07451 [Aphanomyces astaci]